MSLSLPVLMYVSFSLRVSLYVVLVELCLCKCLSVDLYLCVFSVDLCIWCAYKLTRVYIRGSFGKFLAWHHNSTLR